MNSAILCKLFGESDKNKTGRLTIQNQKMRSIRQKRHLAILPFWSFGYFGHLAILAIWLFWLFWPFGYFGHLAILAIWLFLAILAICQFWPFVNFAIPPKSHSAKKTTFRQNNETRSIQKETSFPKRSKHFSDSCLSLDPNAVPQFDPSAHPTAINVSDSPIQMAQGLRRQLIDEDATKTRRLAHVRGEVRSEATRLANADKPGPPMSWNSRRRSARSRSPRWRRSAGDTCEASGADRRTRCAKS